MPFAVVDVETTGFSPLADDRIIEIAIVKVTAEGLSDEYTTLVNPLRDVGPSYIHGITDADVAQAPTFAEIVGDVLERLGGAVFVAHNVRFDRDFLAAELSLAGVFLPAIPSLCTLQFSYRLNPKLTSHKLRACCIAAGLLYERRHAALHDARAAANLLLAYMHKAEGLGWTTLEAIGCSPLSFPMQLWPALASSGRTWRRRSHGGTSGELPFLARLVATLDPVEGTNERTAPYFDLLDRALEDRQVTDGEAAALRAVAADWGLSREEVVAAHHAYLDSLIAAAVADGRVTETERQDLEAVTRLLALDPSIAHALLTEGMKERP